ncbi:MAG TPA: hypothetical protein VIL95_08360 [Bacillota bacterium]
MFEEILKCLIALVRDLAVGGGWTPRGWKLIGLCAVLFGVLDLAAVAYGLVTWAEYWPGSLMISVGIVVVIVAHLQEKKPPAS